jgi:LysR family transcriptional regulator, repressor for citA
MDFDWLQTFVTAAKYENFRKAADTLYISQPTVTVHIKLLEEELGFKLFERKGRKIYLTKQGRMFKDQAMKLLTSYQKGLEEINSYTQGYSHKLTIAIDPLIADTVLPSVLKRYVKEHKNVELEVRVVQSLMIEELVSSGQVDIGISCIKSINNALTCDLLYEDEILFVVPHDGHDLESAPPMDEEDLLSKYYLLTHSHPEYWGDLLNKVKQRYPFVKTMKVSEVHITKRFITEDLGVSYLPSSTVRRELLEGRLVDIKSSLTPLPVTQTYGIYKYDQPITRNFLSYLKKFRY